MSRQGTVTDALRETLGAEMERDASVFLMGEDIGRYGGAFGVTRGLLDRFGPDRVINTPISECSFVGMAAGAAAAGRRPVVEIMFMDFLTLAADPLVNYAAKLRYVFGEQARCPLVVRTAGGAGRNYGPTHSQSLEAWFAHVPGIKVVAPASPADAAGLLSAAIRDDNPVLFVEHKLLYDRRGPLISDGAIPLGKANVVRAGSDLTLVAWSWMCSQAEAAAEDLQSAGVSVEIIDPRTLYPLDTDCLAESARKTGRVLIVEEGPRFGGIGAEIACSLFEQAYDYLDAPIRRISGTDTPVPAGPVLERAARPDRQRIVDAAVALVQA